MTKLSVITITKNQEWNVNRLISSILAHTAKIDSVQVILVDSASIDGTIAASCKYPITVIRWMLINRCLPPPDVTSVSNVIPRLIYVFLTIWNIDGW
jgi:glycosyltransferase involved in cell wall biosynthesis